MTELLSLARIALYAVMVISTIAAVGVVLLPNIFYAALALVVVLIGTACIFLAVHAEFLAVVQILIYVGAVMTLVIFAIMLTNRFGDLQVRQHNSISILSLGAVIVFIQALYPIIQKTPWPVREEALQAKVSAADLGSALMGTYVFPFEVISIVLIAALIGAIVIAKKDRMP